MANISKSVNGWKVDGIAAFLSRDGLTLLNGAGKVLAVMTAKEVETLRGEDDAARAVRTAPRKPAAARVAKERAWDRGYNEGGEGYNPYRRGSARTYR
jgi:hypothetical protein